MIQKSNLIGKTSELNNRYNLGLGMNYTNMKLPFISYAYQYGEMTLENGDITTHNHIVNSNYSYSVLSTQATTSVTANILSNAGTLDFASFDVTNYIISQDFELTSWMSLLSSINYFKLDNHSEDLEDEVSYLYEFSLPFSVNQYGRTN